MNILLIAATLSEIQTTIDYYKNNNLLEKNIDHLITGIGLMQTTYHLTQYLQNNTSNIIIQAGIAGCFHNKYMLGDVVLVDKDFLGDMGVIEDNHFKNIFDLKLIDAKAFPFSDNALINPHKNILDKIQLPKVISVSINEITTQPDRIQYYQQKYNAEVESMEGAAFHYVCLQQNIPFIQMRSISNRIGIRDKAKWKIKEAIENLNKQLINCIKLL